MATKFVTLRHPPRPDAAVDPRPVHHDRPMFVESVRVFGHR